MIVQVVYDAFRSGAVAERAKQEIDALLALGREVLLLTDMEPPAGTALPAGLTVETVRPVTLPKLRMLAREASASVGFAAALRRLARTRKVELVVCHHSTLVPALALVARRLGAPVVFVVHALVGDRIRAGVSPYPRSATLLLLRANKIACQQADAVICVSRHTAVLALEEGTPPERILVLPCAVDTDVFTPPPPGAERDIDVLYVGRLSIEKGVDVLLDATERLHADVGVVIVGDGPQRQHLEEQVRIRRLPVQLVGRAEREAIVGWYQRAKVVAMPSLSEPQGVVALEAMACGVPVVASAVGGLSATIRDGVDGRLVPPGDSSALAAALTDVLGGGLDSVGAAEEGRRTALEFNLPRLQERVGRLYTLLAAGASPATAGLAVDAGTDGDAPPPAGGDQVMLTDLLEDTPTREHPRPQPPDAGAPAIVPAARQAAAFAVPVVSSPTASAGFAARAAPQPSTLAPPPPLAPPARPPGVLGPPLSPRDPGRARRRRAAILVVLLALALTVSVALVQLLGSSRTDRPVVPLKPAASAPAVPPLHGVVAAGTLQPADVWVPGTSGESIELGDHALSFDVQLGSTRSTVSMGSYTAGSPATSSPETFTTLIRLPSGAVRGLPGVAGPTPVIAGSREGLSLSSTTLEGAQEGLRVDLQATRPTMPSAGVDDLASKATNSPYMYLRLQVRNDSGKAMPATSALISAGSSCGTPQTLPGLPDYLAVPYCGPTEQAHRTLLVPKNLVSGTTVAANPERTFLDTGALTPAAAASGRAAVGLAVPALAPRQTWSMLALYTSWDDGDALLDANDSLGYYYHRWWPNAAVLQQALFASAPQVLTTTATSDANVLGSLGSDARFAALTALRAWRHSSWLAAGRDGHPFAAMTEGGYGWLSTVDVGYEYQIVQNRFEPWRSRLELDEWRAHLVSAPGGAVFLPHDLGQWSQVTPVAAYDWQKGQPAAGHRLRPVENNVDAVLMALAWEKATGQHYDHGFVSQLLASAETQDSNGDGTLDVRTLRVCAAAQTCYSAPTGTTYDGPLRDADQEQAGNTVLTLKLAYAEAVAAARGLRPSQGPDFATLAGRHLHAVLGHLRDWSSLASLDGAGFPPGYLGEALVYLPLLGSASPVTEALPAVAGAMTSNRAAVTTHCTGACLPRVGSGEREVWVSKALDDDVAAQWMRLHVLGATTPPSALGAIRTALVDRTRSSDHGTLEALDGPSGAPVPHGWWYPRTGAAWAWEGAP